MHLAVCFTKSSCIRLDYVSNIITAGFTVERASKWGAAKLGGKWQFSVFFGNVLPRICEANPFPSFRETYLFLHTRLKHISSLTPHKAKVVCAQPRPSSSFIATHHCILSRNLLVVNFMYIPLTATK